jgi:hypothetical protein
VPKRNEAPAIVTVPSASESAATADTTGVARSDLNASDRSDM